MSDLLSGQNLLSGRIKKTPSSKVSVDRYKWIKLQEVEPDAGIPSANNGIFSSDITGERKWLQIDAGLTVDSSGNIKVNEATLPVDSSNLSYSTSDNLSGLLSDLDDVLLNVEGLVATFIDQVETDDTLSGDGTQQAPLSVNQGNLSVQKRDDSFVSTKLTNFLSVCLKISPDTYKDNNIAKVYTKSDIVSILVKNRNNLSISAKIDHLLTDNLDEQFVVSNRDNTFVTPLVTRTKFGNVLNIINRSGSIVKIKTDVKSSVDILV